MSPLHGGTSIHERPLPPATLQRVIERKANGAGIELAQEAGVPFELRLITLALFVEKLGRERPRLLYQYCTSTRGLFLSRC